MNEQAKDPVRYQTEDGIPIARGKRYKKEGSDEILEGIPVKESGQEKAMQIYGNQRFNAALSEAIEKMKVFYNSHYMGPEKDILEILEGLKIKP